MGCPENWLLPPYKVSSIFNIHAYWCKKSSLIHHQLVFKECYLLPSSFIWWGSLLLEKPATMNNVWNHCNPSTLRNWAGQFWTTSHLHYSHAVMVTFAPSKSPKQYMTTVSLSGCAWRVIHYDTVNDLNSSKHSCLLLQTMQSLNRQMPPDFVPQKTPEN